MFECLLRSVSFCSLQVFDSNANKDKLLRLKLGSGKVIKVPLRGVCVCRGAPP